MIIKGKNVCVETILSERPVKKVIMKESFNDRVIEKIKSKKIPFEFMNDQRFNKLYPNAQGIVCEIDEYSYASLDECLEEVNKNSLVLILDGIEDPQNLGNMIRTLKLRRKNISNHRRKAKCHAFACYRNTSIGRICRKNHPRPLRKISRTRTW